MADVVVAQLATGQNHVRWEPFETSSGEKSGRHVTYYGTQGGRTGDIITLHPRELVDDKGFPRSTWDGPAPGLEAFGRLTLLSGGFPRTPQQVKEDAKPSAPSSIEILLSNVPEVIIGELPTDDDELREILAYEQSHKNRGGVVDAIKDFLGEGDESVKSGKVPAKLPKPSKKV